DHYRYKVRKPSLRQAVNDRSSLARNGRGAVTSISYRLPTKSVVPYVPNGTRPKVTALVKSVELLTISLNNAVSDTSPCHDRWASNPKLTTARRYRAPSAGPGPDRPSRASSRPPRTAAPCRRHV